MILARADWLGRLTEHASRKKMIMFCVSSVSRSTVSSQWNTVRDWAEGREESQLYCVLI